MVVLAVGEGESPTIMVAPITSQDPGNPDAIKLSPGAFGLNRPSWIIHWEVNTFRWVGPDVGIADKSAGAWWRLGALAPELRTKLADRIQAAMLGNRVHVVRRNE